MLLNWFGLIFFNTLSTIFLAGVYMFAGIVALFDILYLLYLLYLQEHVINSNYHPLLIDCIANSSLTLVSIILYQMAVNYHQ